MVEGWKEGCRDAGQNQRLMANNGNSINSFHLCPRVGCVAESIVTQVSAGRSDFYFIFETGQCLSGSVTSWRHLIGSQV